MAVEWLPNFLKTEVLCHLTYTKIFFIINMFHFKQWDISNSSTIDLAVSELNYL